MDHIEFGDLEKNGEMTLEKLAAMVAPGFHHVDKRMDRVENLLIAEHRMRIEKLEQQMKEMREALAL